MSLNTNNPVEQSCCLKNESCSIKSYFSSSQWVVYALVALAGILMRWLELDVRPYHHDESQHAMFGKYFYDFPEIQYYKYDPMMHGPLLYNFMRLVYTALGNTLWSARAPIALIGTMFIFAPLLFRKYFSPFALLCLTAAISLSSTMVYWSRFLIHDFFVLLAQLIMLYGVVASKPQQRSFYVLLGIALQFCIKANVFVTLALILGYMVFEAAYKYFFLDSSHKKPAIDFFNYIIRTQNILIFSGVFAIFAIGSHLLLAKSISSDSQHWGSLLTFSQHIPQFLAVCFVICFVPYSLSYFIFKVKDNYLSCTIDNIRHYKLQFVFALAFATLVLCYIVSSGFRHNTAILDLLFRTSIPYWLNQHNIERITGPFLFNFYMLSWYELFFMVFVFIQTALFYRSAPSLAKWCGAVTLAVSAIVGLFFLFYTAPETAGGYFQGMSEIGKKTPEKLESFSDLFTTAYVFNLFAIKFIGFFKLKDCLDAFAALIIVLHPVILTATHIARGEKVLAFWGYFFTATFFSYSYLGEKVPWLSMYPLVVGFIYLVLFFDDWFKRNPISDYSIFPLSRVLRSLGFVTLFLAIFFVLESFISLSGIVANFSFAKVLDLFRYHGIINTYKSIKEGVVDNILLFVLGFTFYVFYFADRWTHLLGRVNLKVLIFVLVSIFCIRSSILVNFVYGGSETQFISQVHTTSDFHNIMLKLRQESKSNLGEEPYKVLGDGDPVWPMTWYFVGINDFKWQASDEEKKDFHVILQTWKEDATNIPEGFEKKRLNLRGWWVPDYNQMTLKKFLNFSVNHIPWSPSGFTYVWLLKNRSK